MYCSGKFFVPTMTFGFAAAVRCDAAAVPPKTSGTPSAIANAALAARRVCLRTICPPCCGPRRGGPYPPRAPLGEGDRVVPEADPQDREAEGDQDEARQRPPHVRDADRQERPAVEVTEPDPERQREQERDPDGRSRELHVLERLVREQAEVVVHEAERIH